MSRCTSAPGHVILLLCVDDMIITDNDASIIASLQKHQQSQFETKHLGVVRYFLGIEATIFSRLSFFYNRSVLVFFFRVSD